MSLRSTPAVADPKLYREVQTGRSLEAARQVDDAIVAYLRGGAHREAARLLSFEGRYCEAAEALLQGLPAEPTPIGHLTANGHKGLGRFGKGQHAGLVVSRPAPVKHTVLDGRRPRPVM